jgi:hypothetical protein
MCLYEISVISILPKKKKKKKNPNRHEKGQKSNTASFPTTILVRIPTEEEIFQDYYLFFKINKVNQYSVQTFTNHNHIQTTNSLSLFGYSEAYNKENLVVPLVFIGRVLFNLFNLIRDWIHRNSFFMNFLIIIWMDIAIIEGEWFMHY